MVKRRTTLREECEQLLVRHNHLAARPQRHLGIYVRSLQARFSSMDYSLSELQRLIDLATQPTTEDHSPFESQQEKRAFYSDCFWSFSYSVFDILANIMNTVHREVKDEAWVSFAYAANGYNSIPNRVRGTSDLPVDVRKTVAAITKRQYFKRLAGYRRCSLHRRAVCARESLTQVSLSAPYQHTTDPNESKMVVLICDDPEDMAPKFSKQRLLEDECAQIRSSIEEDVRKIIRIV